MTRGLNRQQIGVTEEMITTFGDAIFKMSHNHQVRTGDPYRNLDWDEVEKQREDMGLADGQIAKRIGLSQNQVLYIRTVMERRRFRTENYVRLLELGGGKRFRAERFTPHLDHFKYSEDALELRAAMDYPQELATKYVEQGWWRDDTLRKYLDLHAVDRADKPAIVAGERTISWSDLHAVVERLARGLQEIGIGPGDLVAIQLPNIPEFIISNLAITRVGAVMQTIHMPYRAAELETLINHGRSKAFICLADAKDWSPAKTVKGLQPKLPTLRHVIALGEAVDGALSLGDMMESELDTEIEAKPVASDPFLLLYTSGTTSAPKGVPLSYHNMLTNARLDAPEHKLTDQDRILSAAPFSHLYGLYAFHMAMVTGAANVLLPVFTPPDLADAIQSRKPTALWLAPAHIAALSAGGFLESHDFSSATLMICAGSALSPALMRTFKDKTPGCEVTQLWGMTELQAGMFTRPDDGTENGALYAGRASPGAEIRVVDPETDKELPRGKEGELQIRGPMLFPGYLRNDAANKTAFSGDHYFKSGDLAVMNEEGFVALTGRNKDVINRGGVKFNPADIENLLDAHPAIMMSAVAPVPDEKLGERACAYIQLAPGAEALTLETICAYLLEHKIAKNKLPEKLAIMDELPLTPTRKVIKGKLVPPAG